MKSPHVSRLTRFLLSVLALSFGVVLIGASLTAVQPVSSLTHPATARKLYFGQTILPDHVLYPALMAADRVKLELSDDPQEQVLMQVNYAERRLEAAQELIERGNLPRAHETLTKSQKYLINAGLEALEHDLPPETRQYVLKALQHNFEVVERLKPTFAQTTYTALDQLQEQNQTLQDQLK